MTPEDILQYQRDATLHLWAQAGAMAKLHDMGASYRWIAKQFGVSHATVCVRVKWWNTLSSRSMMEGSEPRRVMEGGGQ